MQHNALASASGGVTEAVPAAAATWQCNCLVVLGVDFGVRQPRSEVTSIKNGSQLAATANKPVQCIYCPNNSHNNNNNK